MIFTKGEHYAGAFIVDKLKADRNSKPYFILHHGTQVMAFALNRWQNPEAPREILVGYGEGRETYTDHFVRDQPVVPVFIKERQTDELWLCAGYFKLTGINDEVPEKNSRGEAPRRSRHLQNPVYGRGPAMRSILDATSAVGLAAFQCF